MDYLAASFALIAAIMGVVGNTWDRKCQGIRRVTRVGWVALTCGVVAFVVSVVQTHSRNDELHQILHTKETFARRAYSDIEQALKQIHGAISDLYAAYLHKERPITSPDWSSALEWDKDRGFLDFVSNLDMTESSIGNHILDGESWAHFLSRKLRRAREDLETVLAVYGPYMEREDVLAVDRVRTCELLQYVPDLEDVYRRAKIKPLFPVMWLPELGEAYVSLRDRLPPQDEP